MAALIRWSGLHCIQIPEASCVRSRLARPYNGQRPIGHFDVRLWASAIVVADHEYFDNFLNTLPDAYQALARQGIYGDFFSFYLCDVVLKLNGKGGQPVYVKVAGQSTGRCAPR